MGLHEFRQKKEKHSTPAIKTNRWETDISMKCTDTDSTKLDFRVTNMYHAPYWV